MGNTEKKATSEDSGELVSKHAHDAVSVYLLNSEKTHVLMLFHKKLQAWLPPGGHADEDLPQDAAVRELAEETGIEDLSFLVLDSGALHIESSDQQQLDVDEIVAPRGNRIKKPFAVIKEKIPGSTKEPEHSHTDYVYVGLTNTPMKEVKIDLRESERQQWLPLTQQAIGELRTFSNVKAILDKLHEFRTRALI